MNRITSVAALLTKCALLFTVLLLLSNLRTTTTREHAWLSSLPLALAGIAYAVLQIRMKPDGWTLAKRLLLAAAFIFWAIDQFLPPGRFAALIGDAVVSAYVLDLHWIVQDQRDSG
jgi:phosphatidylserine synthase